MQRCWQQLVARLAAMIVSGVAASCDAAPPLAPFGLPEICRATVSVLMGRQVKLIKVDQMEGDVVAVHYVRPDDKTRWDYRCKTVGQRVLWASLTGRWRDHPMDEVLSFAVVGTTLKIDQRFTDGSGSTKSFSVRDFRD